MAISRVLPSALLAVLLISSHPVMAAAEEEVVVVTLDAGNFSEVVGKHQFIVVEFYAPWCGHCSELAPEYEKAASVLSKHDPPVVLAKVDAYDERNGELRAKYEVQGYPTIKILRDQGRDVRDYNGPRDAGGIVSYLKRQLGPASVEVKTAEDVASSMSDKGVAIDFDKDALEKFIEVSGFPTVVTFDADPTNHKYLNKYYSIPSAKAMLFLNFSDDRMDTFRSQLHEAARQFGSKNISFLIGDVAAAEGAFQYFGLKESQVPLLFVLASTGKYLKPTVEPDQILPWLKEYTGGNLAPYVRSEPIPEVNDQPVKVIVADNLRDAVFKSGENVLLEFYAPWCGHCQKLAPILEEVALSLQDDVDVVIAKMDGTVNDIPSEFAVEGYPTLYFYSSDGNLQPYDGEQTAEEIIDFIYKNKGSKTGADAVVDEIVQTDTAVVEDVTYSESIKDEL